MDRSSTTKKAPLFYILMLTLAALVTGIVNALIMKEQGLRSINDRPFVHPIFQAFEVFFAEGLLLLIFYGLSKYSPKFSNEVVEKRNEGMKGASLAEPNILLPLIPAFVDFCGMTLQFTSILAVLPSVFLMLRCTAPIINAIFSAIFLNTKLYIHQKLGILLVLSGAIIVCVIQVVIEGENDREDAVWGLIFILCSLVTTGVQHIIEQKICKKHYYHPFQLAGFEGAWGLVIAGVALAIASFIPCPPASPFCSTKHFEDVKDIFNFLTGNAFFLILVIATIINIILVSFLGRSVSKSVPSPLQASIGFLVIVGGWFYAVFRLGQSFHGIQLFAFFLIILGHFVYQKIVVITIPGLMGKKRDRVSLGAKINETTSLLNESDV